jgi:hypothetical protein
MFCALCIYCRSSTLVHPELFTYFSPIATFPCPTWIYFDLLDLSHRYCLYVLYCWKMVSLNKLEMKLLWDVLVVVPYNTAEAFGLQLVILLSTVVLELR